MAAARMAIMRAPKKPFNKKKILLAGLFSLFLLNPAMPFLPVTSLSEGTTVEKTCSGIIYNKVVNPHKLYAIKPVKKKIANPILHKNVSKIIKGTPMEKMTDAIANRDETTAAFIVGIAMKESKFGKYSPKKEGRECYNYWGYRGKENTTKSGYSCFDSPDHAIKVVGDRISRIVKQGAQTPEQMISWKCGSTCAGHSPESVDKWIADVGINYYRIQDAVKLARK